METIKLALDWTPNINHIGFFVAREKGFYQDKELEVELQSPAGDDYSVTPAKKVELGQADFALCPMESILSYQTKEEPFDLKAFAAIYQEDLSAIVCTKSSGITSPKDLDGKSYASYEARYEDELVMQMIRNAGGNGNTQIGYPRKLGIWETLLNGEFDSTWIFMNWEGIQASGKGVDLISFKMSDYHIPYSYSPVIAGSEKMILAREEPYKKFLAATMAGFQFTAENPVEAAKILSVYVSKTDADIDLEAAIQASSSAFGLGADWGKMDLNNLQKYLDWIYEKELEYQKLSADDLVSNQLL